MNKNNRSFFGLKKGCYKFITSDFFFGKPSQVNLQLFLYSPFRNIKKE